ncbi:MAG TPA: fumarylacetoacetate hydrolase family protein [Nitrososphaerales archaeon]|nr:fumarylacetoacetate hydrolase family protein [Nitrososphaerales archaeon]
MRIVTFSVLGDSRLGLFTDEGVVDLARACSKYSSDGLSVLFSDARRFLDAGELAMKLAKEVGDAAREETASGSAKDTGTLVGSDQVRLLAPIQNPQKIYCTAVNYLSHGAESGFAAPEVPYIFTKFVNALVGLDAPIIHPKTVKNMDMEAELGVVIGKRGKDIPPGRAFSHVAGYTCVNDVSFRDLQYGPEGPKVMNPYGQNWTKGKGLDTACPLGPWIVTRDEMEEPYPLKIIGRQNGEVIQKGNTNEMVHNVQSLVSYVSQGTTLEPGDVISTGVPARVEGIERKYLSVGDIVEVEIERIGVLRNRVVAG